MLAGETEQKVFERARDGDRAAVKQLYDSFSKYVTAICARFIPEPGELEDVIQDSFVKIFTSLDRFDYRGEGSLKAWVRQIAVNEALKALSEEEIQNKSALILIQGMQALGEYISEERAHAHPEVFNLLHAFHDGLTAVSIDL